MRFSTGSPSPRRPEIQSLDVVFRGSAAILVAGSLRGFSGFGIALAGVPLLCLAMALWQGVIAPSELWLGIALCPALFLGTALGTRVFRGDFKRHYLKVGLAVLLAIGLGAALRGATGLWSG